MASGTGSKSKRRGRALEYWLGFIDWWVVGLIVRGSCVIERWRRRRGRGLNPPPWSPGEKTRPLLPWTTTAGLYCIRHLGVEYREESQRNREESQRNRKGPQRNRGESQRNREESERDRQGQNGTGRSHNGTGRGQRGMCGVKTTLEGVKIE